MNIRDIILSSYQLARSQNADARSAHQRHAQRGREWVRALAHELGDWCAGERATMEVRTFSRHDSTAQRAFGMNEMLHDICICQIGTTRSPTHRRELQFIKKAFWQVESEFAHDTHDAVVDFGKLVLGSAQNKLFVGPLVRDTEAFLETLLPVAVACSESCPANVYLALVPHPSVWDTKPETVAVYILKNNGWEELH